MLKNIFLVFSTTFCIGYASNIEATINLLPNSSFEESSEAREIYPIVGEYRSFDRNNWRIDKNEKYHGLQSLCVFGKRAFFWQVLNEDSLNNVFSVYLKSSMVNQKIEIGFELLSFCDDGAVVVEGRTVKSVSITDSWKRYSVASAINPKIKRRWVNLHIFRVWIKPITKARFWVDAAQLEKCSTAPSKYQQGRGANKLWKPILFYQKDVKYQAILKNPVTELKIKNSAEKSGEIKISTVETQGVNWRKTPVWGGIPFPKGALFNAEKVRLYDEHANKIPIQVKILARWHIDGSVKSLLVNFQTDALPHGKNNYILKYGCEKNHKINKNIITEHGNEFVIDTGAVKAIVPKDSSLIFKEINTAGKTLRFGKANSGCFTIDLKGRQYSSNHNDGSTATIELNGSLHAVIRLKGTCFDDLGKSTFSNFEVRIHAFAEKKYFLIQYAFENREPELNTVVRSVFMRLPVFSTNEVPQGMFQVNGDTFFDYRLTDGRNVVLTQLHHYFGKGEYEIALDDYDKGELDKTVFRKVKSNGKCFAGSTCVKVDDFWQLNPKALEISGKFIGVYIWPKQHVRFMDLPTGISNSVDIIYAPFQNDSNAPMPSRNNNVLLQVDPSWVASTGVFGHFLDEKETLKSFPFYNRRINDFFDVLAKKPQQEDLTGTFDYGDIGTPSAWMNNETTALRCLLAQYLRTNDATVLRRAQILVRHLRDVDTCRFQDGVFLMQHPPGRIHTTYWFSTGHFWITGLIWHYMLTGDMRSYETVKSLGTMLVAWSGKAYKGRNRSRLLYHLAELYDLTHFKCFREAYERQYNFAKPTEITEKYNRDYYGGTGLSAIFRWYSTTGEQKYMDRLRNEWNELYKKRANGTPGERVETDRGWCIFTALAEAANFTHDSKFIEGFMRRMVWFLVSTHGFGANAVRGSEFLYAAKKVGVKRNEMFPDQLLGIDILTGKTPEFTFKIKMIDVNNEKMKLKIYRTRLFRVWRHPYKQDDAVRYVIKAPNKKLLIAEMLSGKSYQYRELELNENSEKGEYDIEFQSLHNGQGAISCSTPRILLDSRNKFTFRRDRGGNAFVKFYFRAPASKNHITLKYKRRWGRKKMYSTAAWLENEKGELIDSKRWLQPLGTEFDAVGNTIGSGGEWKITLAIPKECKGDVLSITITAFKGEWTIKGLDYPYLAPSPKSFTK